MSLASQLAGAARNALCADNGLCIRQDRARVGIDRLAERVLVDRRLCLCVSDRHRSATHERRLAVARESASDRAKASAEPHRARPSRVVGRTGPAAQAPSTAYAPARQTGSRQDTDEPIEVAGQPSDAANSSDGDQLDRSAPLMARWTALAHEAKCARRDADNSVAIRMRRSRGRIIDRMPAAVRSPTRHRIGLQHRCGRPAVRSWPRCSRRLRSRRGRRRHRREHRRPLPPTPPPEQHKADDDRGKHHRGGDSDKQNSHNG